MNTVLKYSLIAAGAGLVGFVVIKKLAPAPAPTVKPSVLGQVVAGVKLLADAFSSSDPAPSPLAGTPLEGTIIDPASFAARRAPTPGNLTLGLSPNAAYATATGDGDAAMSDALGLDRTSGREGQPALMTRYSQTAIGGTAPSPYRLV